MMLFLLFHPAGAIDIPVGTTAPGFALPTIDGKLFSLARYRGSIIILIYWRRDQPRSLLSLKDGQDILSRFGDRGVKVVGLIANSDNIDHVNTILKDNKITYSVLLDSERQVFGDYGIHVYPSTIIINREGRIAKGVPGHALNYRQVIEAHVRYILGDIDEQKMHELAFPQKKIIEESVLTAHRLYNLALKFTDDGFLDMAVETVKKSLDANKDSAQSHILLGFLYLEENNANTAFESFNEALRLEPDSHDAKTGLGGALILKGDIERALDVLTDAVSENPYPEMTYYELGRVYELKGDKDRAIEMYKKALQEIIHNKLIPSIVSRCR